MTFNRIIIKRCPFPPMFINIQEWLGNCLHTTLKWPSKIVILWNSHPSIFINIQQWLSYCPYMTMNGCSKVWSNAIQLTLINTQQWFNYYPHITFKWPSKMESDKHHCDKNSLIVFFSQIPKCNSFSYKLELTLLSFLSILSFLISVVSVDFVFSAICLLHLPSPKWVCHWFLLKEIKLLLILSKTINLKRTKSNYIIF